jgi:hypothetical protein
MGKKLQNIFEMQFSLMYHLHMSIRDFNENDTTENNWLFSRLIKEKEDETNPKETGTLKHG